jgi:hypothetical protein
MRVYIGPYKNWFGPYQLASALCFWAKPVKDEYGFEREPDWVHNFGMWLAGDKEDEDGNSIGKDSLLYRFLKWVDSKRKRKIKIRIDKYDTWGMDSTLALIVLPMLKQLKETKHGSQNVDMEDVPESMRLISHETYEDQKCFDFYHEDNELNMQNIQCDIHDRWDWVMAEMIWAFEQLQPDCDWKEQYTSGKMDVKWKKCDIDGKSGYEMVRGPNDTYKADYEGMDAHQARINNGLRLFGKYFQGLWD